tara:strand:- start:36 stop:287 length:252 start_codon:yes stop_codon:yes gene_type:complete
VLTEISHEGDEGEEMPELQTVWAQGQEQSRQVLSAMFQRDRCCKSSHWNREFTSTRQSGQRWQYQSWTQEDIGWSEERRQEVR